MHFIHIILMGGWSMKKKAEVAGGAVVVIPQLHLVRLLWIVWKVVIVMSIALCLLAFVRIQRHSAHQFSATTSASSTSSVVQQGPRLLSSRYSKGNAKIAFLFLAKWNLPLDFLWGSFFEHAEEANFSIFIHSEPGFVFNESTTRSAFFYDRQVKNSVKVSWGDSSMIEAERLLLKAAIEDPSNQRLVFLSDSCVPLYNFSYIYAYLMASPRSYVDSFRNVKYRYNPKMSPFIPITKWRKGSQWITLVRKHAEIVADDQIFFPVFKMFCKEFEKKYCIPDEHYVQTLLAMKDLEDEIERRTVTFTLWSEATSTKWHPMTFKYEDAGSQQLQKIKDINNIDYETESRTEWCQNNSTFVPCFLFARKFTEGAAMRLLSEGVLGRRPT